VRIDSVRFDASGNATVVASGGISFYIPRHRIAEIPEGIPRQGQDLEDENPAWIAIERIAEEEEALQRAIRLCSRAEQSSIGLVSKLSMRGFSRAAIDFAVSKMENKGMLDDVRYASVWARTRSESRLQGPLRTASELRARGFDESTVRAALASVDFDAILEKALAKGLGDTENCAPGKELLDSIASDLKLKGFRSEAVSRSIENLT